MGKKWSRLLPTLLVLLSLFVVYAFSSVQVSAEIEEEAKERELLVEFAESHRSFSSSTDVTGVESREEIAEHVELWRLDKGEDLLKMAEQLKEEPNVLIVEPNYKRDLHSSTNDPYLYTQWWVPQVKPQPIWMRVAEQKKNAVVAVIDSGIAIHHEDLQGRIQQGGYNFVHNTMDVTDVNGHGTAVSGVIAASSGNGIGITGIAGSYDVKILPLKVSHLSGSSYVSDSIRAIDYAIERKVDVINMSLGNDQSSILEQNAVQRAVRAGITVVASAGNEALEGNPVNYPASYPEVISVGATDQQNRRASFSNYNSYVDVVAPGVGVYTTALTNTYKQASGTSFSSPIVAGAAALVKSLQPDASPAQVKAYLEGTAMDLGQPGKDTHYGAGLLNLEELNDKLLPAVVPVTGVNIRHKNVTIDLDTQQKTAFSTERVSEQLESLRRQKAVYFESEPNDTFMTANRLPLGNSIVGTITDYYFDMDHYRFTLDTPGTFSMIASWIDDSYISHQDNEYLFVGIHDARQELIDVARLTTTSGGRQDMYYSKQLPKGDYYLVILQSSPYKYLFTDAEYMITSLFTPVSQPKPEPVPTFLFDSIFMKVGLNDQFVMDIESDAQLSSTNEQVATVDQTGKVYATGYGSAKLLYKSKSLTKEATVKVARNSKSKTAALFEQISPIDATNKEVTWSSSNPTVASVDQYGIITGEKAGKTTITVTTNDGGFTASSTVTVIGGAPPEFIGTHPDLSVGQNKVFTVTFSQDLKVGKDYSKDILISRSPEHSDPITAFTATVDPLTPNKLYIQPNSSWEEGVHYMTISKSLQNKDTTPLAKVARLKFDVIGNFTDGKTNEVKRYERVLSGMR
ncbi:hypothetical protein CSV61_08580 [Sporosarcina sp. P3]|uniref:S8 family serine peptidase n=1 Tax=Sporosarcina sp. P3 TaxID=2048245 RepID=UPI000C16FC0F|nr:S8 family serine peptidase [Sporosarcina sp. P3]PID21746.1 hypothetical protein CSV61_08580 [Sporosarcina sp. P3]